MSKFFFKGRIEKKPKHHSCGFNTKRVTKPGSETSPLSLSVTSDERKTEIEAVLLENGLFATIAVDADIAEDITELDGLLNTPKTIVLEETPKRNDPCSCGSGKKYKKCCG